MSERVYQGLTVGYCLALTQFVMVLVLGIMYLRRSDRVYDPLAAKASSWPSRRRSRRAPASSETSAATRRRCRDDRRSPPRSTARRVVVFAVVLAITLGITYWASKRATQHGGFYAAGRRITGMQNGLAISGDYLSAASFLGIAGLIFLFGFDGFLYSIGFLVAFLTVMFLLAERMRNAGKYTIADVLAFRLRERPARAAAALGTLAVAAFYLIAQMVGAGVLIEKLVGINFTLAVRHHRRVHALLRRLRRHGRHDVGADHQGRAADGRHRRHVDLRARQGRLQPDRAVQPGRRRTRAPRATFSLGPGTFLPKPIDTVSLGLALVLGTAGLPHILMRFFTVPNAKAARSSVGRGRCSSSGSSTC